VTIALLTDALAHRSLDEALEWCAHRGFDAVELGVGGYSPAPHLDRAAVLGGRVRDAGLEIAAFNASGNPLHPARAVAAEHDEALRAAIELAAALDVPRVVAMSGCPGGPGESRWPVFAGGAWLPDMEGLWEHQWPALARYWSGLSAWAARDAPGVAICLELHPGTSIYNAASFALLAGETVDNIRVNLDPSHFWWQGIDPVATIEALAGRIGFAHGKDTLLHPERIALHGVLDFRWPAAPESMPWHFCAVGRGRSIEEWRRLLDALRAAGYDGPISIEHEDPELGPEDGVEASLEGLRAALAAAVPGG
jgi:sugar phosphate isomerase/epimerase